jgi:hypothetical protein
MAGVHYEGGSPKLLLVLSVPIPTHDSRAAMAATVLFGFLVVMFHEHEFRSAH